MFAGNWPAKLPPDGELFNVWCYLNAGLPFANKRRTDNVVGLPESATHLTEQSRTMPRIVVLDTLSPDGLKLLEEARAKGIEYQVRTGLKGDGLRETLVQFEGAICRSGVKITAEALAGNHKLKAIVRAGVGTDNIDKEAATRLGIVVMNTPAGNTLSTAEHTWALMLALSRNVAPAYHSLLEHKWDRNKYMGAAGREDIGRHWPGPYRASRGQTRQSV